MTRKVIYHGSWSGGKIKIADDPVTKEEVFLDSDNLERDASGKPFIWVSDEAAEVIVATFPRGVFVIEQTPAPQPDIRAAPSEDPPRKRT